MSKLISGKEALIALANGQEVEYQAMDKKFYPLKDFLDSAKIRLKPQTITINGIEVPAPFDPKDGDYVYLISDQSENGWIKTKHKSDFGYMFGAWHTEDEIKQVIKALKSVFKPQ